MWNGKFTDMRLALELLFMALLFVLLDSTVAIASVWSIAACDMACIADLKLIVDMVGS